MTWCSVGKVENLFGFVTARFGLGRFCDSTRRLDCVDPNLIAIGQQQIFSTLTCFPLDLRRQFFANFIGGQPQISVFA